MYVHSVQFIYVRTVYLCTYSLSMYVQDPYSHSHYSYCFNAFVFSCIYKNEISLVDCGDPGQPANGDVNFVTTREEGVANYTCNEGYNLTGVTQRICQSNGSWSGDVPICQS